MICTISPGAKRGSTAPYSCARLAIVEMGDQQPRSLAGAFHTPIPTQGDMVSASVAALAREIRLQDKVYGSSWARRSLIVAEESPIDLIAPRASLAGLRRWTAAFGGA
jgi:CRISPR system Cascade subunit CasC